MNPSLGENSLTRADEGVKTGMEVSCHCGGTMTLVGEEILENRVEQTYHCTKCGEKILTVKDQSWEETMGG